MRALTSVLVLSVATLVACDRSASLEHVPGPSDDVAIFAALLADECMHPGNAPTLEIVLDVPADVVNEEMTLWKWQPPAEYVDYWARRSSSTMRWPKLAPCANRRVAEKEKVDALLAKDGKIPPSFEYFYAAFPNARGIVQVSLPAYSADGRSAAVLRTFRHDIYASGADVVVLMRDASGWRPAQVHNVRLSIF
jgi:hypothetical protein